MEVLLNLQNKNVTLNAVHVAPEGTNCCNRLKVHFDVFQETAKKAAIIRLSTANSFELIYNPQIEMFGHFKTKSSFHKTKRII